MDKSESLGTNRVQRERGPLRILLVVYLPWEARLGAVKVFIELAEAWRADGHQVDVYSMDEAFPRRTASAPLNALRQVLFNWKAAAFIRKHSDQYDVIDALVGSLRASKTELNFGGLLVARSVGLHRLYDRFERDASERWSGSRGKLVGRIYYSVIASWLRRASDAAIAQANLVSVPNEVEAECLRTEIDPKLAITVHGYGLADERRQAFAQASATANARHASQIISFVGAWNARKGAKDWGSILRSVWRQVPDAAFIFLGTLTDDENVLQDLGLSVSRKVNIVRQYQPDELPNLLANSTVGAFPSYAEGFGFALLEQLASGIPTVAYDSPGPRSILMPGLPELLVPTGNVEEFSAALVRILQMDAPGYQQLARQSQETANRFNWQDIASETAQVYREQIARIR